MNPTSPSHPPGSHRLHRILPALGVVLFIAAVWVLYRQLRDHSFSEIMSAFGAIPSRSLALAAMFTIVGYAILTGYDYLAMKYIKHDMRFGRVSMAALVGYGMSNSIGHSFLTGGTVRFRLYTLWGLAPGEIARVIVFSHVTFYLGMLVLIGGACLLEPGPVAREVRLNEPITRIIGVVMLGLVVVYFMFIRARRAPLRIRQWEIPIPAVKLSFMQLLIGALDMALVGAVLWSLLPALPEERTMTFAGFVGLFMIAQIIGISSQVPGGLGVFEALMVHVMGEQAGEPRVLTALLVYRLVYFIIPLAIAAAWLGLYELHIRRGSK